jgi:hypothetical protein
MKYIDVSYTIRTIVAMISLYSTHEFYSEIKLNYI